MVARPRAELADLSVLCPVVQLAQLTPSHQLVLFKAQFPLPTPTPSWSDPCQGGEPCQARVCAHPPLAWLPSFPHLGFQLGGCEQRVFLEQEHQVLVHSSLDCRETDPPGLRQASPPPQCLPSPGSPFS